MSYLRRFDQPYYTGTAAAALSPSAVVAFDVMINGRGYMIDLNNQEAGAYKFESIPMLHAMFLQDRGTVAIGEHSLNPRDYWRRSVDDWSAGAGQIPLDHAASVPNQFRASKGVDPWTAGQFGMLHDTDRKVTSSNTVLQLEVVGDRLYVLDGSTLEWTLDMVTPSFTTVAATGGDDSLSGTLGMTTDGYTVYVIDANRVHYTIAGASTFTKYHTSDHVAEMIAMAKGRLFSAQNAVLYTHSGTAGSAVATAYYTHPNSDWTWTSITAGLDSIYFAGYSGSTSIIYAATIKPDGTALDVPVAVATLPVGERVRSMRSYFGALIIGTDQGWRVAVIGGSNGQLSIGALVKTDQPPLCFETQDRFMWYGWTNYDTLSTGLGRIDLSILNGTVPAYASDLMATAQGNVTSIVTFQGRRMFTVQGSGVWVENPDRKVLTATLNSGWLNYALADSKVAIKEEIQWHAGAGNFSMFLAADYRAPQQVGVGTITNAIYGNDVTIQIPETIGRVYEVTFVLVRDTGDPSQGPIIDRHTLMVEPQPERRALFTVPLRLHSTEQNRLGANIHYNVAEERRRFFDLTNSRQPVPFQDCEQTYTVIVDDFHWFPYELISRGTARSWDGCIAVELKVVS